MKSIFSLFLIAILCVAMPSASVAVELNQDVTIEVVDQLDITANQNIVEPAEIVIDVGFEDSGVITGVGEDDHQVFRAEFNQYEQIFLSNNMIESPRKGYVNRIHSPPQLGIN